jgi:transcription-repair coupling factor (superfamily II helicase)
MSFDLTFFKDAARLVGGGGTDTVTSLYGSSAALLFSLLDQPAVIILPADVAAEDFGRDCRFWSDVLNMRPPLCVTFDDPLQGIVRLKHLYNGTARKLITSAESMSIPLWEKDDFPILTFLTGTEMERESVLRRLSGLGYLAMPVVTREGEMSLRGGILDIFPPGEENPVRVEFFGDEIESIRYFDIDSQRSIKQISSISLCPVNLPEDGPALIDIFGDGIVILNEPSAVCKRFEAIYEVLEGRRLVNFTALPIENEGLNAGTCGLTGLGLLPGERTSIEDFVRRASALSRDHNLLITCSSDTQARRVRELFLEQDVEVPVIQRNNIRIDGRDLLITVGDLSAGFSFRNSIVMADRDIFGPRPAYRPVKKSKVSQLISSIEDFNEGDYVVHLEHGIGRFIGLKKERIEEYEGDFIILEYRDGARLFVPLDRINTIQKYHAPEGVTPRIDTLGGKSWQQTRKRVRKKVRDMAEKLIKIYAKRTAEKGTAFSADTELHREFDGFFPYEETPDQLTSIAEIRKDMEEPVPMDRLLCGDVGYGKTEVVMRACFKAVYDAKQVAVLVPTTILAEQHYETFKMRFAAFPVRIDFLSRFKSRAEQKKTLKALAEGEIDIIIGTHRLLAKDVIFNDLGLLVVDEEHKFGVAHKEKIKALKSNVDVLSLSATPIPRTLHMALSGIRGMSVIETPPEERLAVKSIVARFSSDIIREALQKEFDRGGQTYFVHNRIKDIYEIGNLLQDLLPVGKIGVAHGRMKERELEEVMNKFFHHEIDVLVSTAIIGSGLDIPAANTIIINRADRFGLADLYQLRGRVGRSNVKAYAYFLIPGEDVITEEARKKIQAIQELGYLGAGFRLALRDLEIRGAGNLLGAEQSGHIEAVGFDMYMEMLESAVAELKGEGRPPSIETAIDLKINAGISEDYIDDPAVRLSIYRRVASVKDIKALDSLRDELKDRFGTPGDPAVRLLDIMELKIMAGRLMITSISRTAGRVRILFSPETPVRSESLFALHKTRKGRIRFLPEGGVELDLRDRAWSVIFSEIKGLLEELLKAFDFQN